MSLLQIGPRRRPPPPIPDQLLDQLLSAPLATSFGNGRSCAVTLRDGSEHPRVTISVVDEFDDRWAKSDPDPPLSARYLAGDEVTAICPSPFALLPALATKAMSGGEIRMGAYRWAVVMRSGDIFELRGSSTSFLPDALLWGDVVDVIPNPPEDYPTGGRIPLPLMWSVSTPQKAQDDRRTYERHFAAVGDRPQEQKAAFADAESYALRQPTAERPLAFEAARDRHATGVSRYERFMGDDIELLGRFANREGHCLVPDGHTEAGRALHITWFVVAASKGELSTRDLKRLETLPGWDDAVRHTSESLPPIHRERLERIRFIAEARATARQDDQDS